MRARKGRGVEKRNEGRWWEGRGFWLGEWGKALGVRQYEFGDETVTT